MTIQNLTKIMFALVLLLGGLYVYFINTMVFDVVGREKALARIGDLGSETASLESEYVELSGQVTLELAANLGFQETSNHTGFALALPGLAPANN